MGAPLPDKIDDVIHGRVRLAIMVFLSNARRAKFTLLRNSLSITGGNLSVHLRRLENAGYVTLEKDFVDRKPRTTVIITDQGLKALSDYVVSIKALIEDVP